jgi:hypothetical protein
MESTDNEPLLAEHPSAARAEEEARNPEATAVTVARMLANPRRIRRN